MKPVDLINAAREVDPYGSSWAFHASRYIRFEAALQIGMRLSFQVHRGVRFRVGRILLNGPLQRAALWRRSRYPNPFETEGRA